MKKLLIFSLIITSGFTIQAQDLSKDVQNTFSKPTHPDGDTTRNKEGWLKGAVISLNATQISNSNWLAAGGDQFSLTAAASLSAFASKRWNKITWGNTLDASYGVVNTTTLGVRKVNDRIDYVTKLGYEPKSWKNLKISLLGQFRSQFTDGYDYNYFGTTTKRRNSGFLAPAYVVLAPGIDWVPKPWISVFASPAATRWTIVTNDPYSYENGGEFPDASSPTGYDKETPLATLYGVDTLKKVKTEFGAFVTISMRKDIFKNVKYIGRVDLYTNYMGNAADVSILSTNQFLLKVNKWLQVTYEIDFLDDDNIKNPSRPTHAEGLQVLSTLGVGFAVKL